MSFIIHVKITDISSTNMHFLSVFSDFGVEYCIVDNNPSNSQLSRTSVVEFVQMKNKNAYLCFSQYYQHHSGHSHITGIVQCESFTYMFNYEL